VLLLDTHVWIWTLEGNARKLGRRTRRLLEREASRDALRISPVSIFEVCALHASGRLRLARPLEQWIHAGLQAAGIRLAPLSLEAAIDAGTIDRARVPDPLDRLLAATARQMEATLLTSDARVLDYAAATLSVRVQCASD
jgi:PIN domain nuclease of toxin-antitoxin system